MSVVSTLTQLEACNIADGIHLLLRSYSLTGDERYLLKVVAPEELIDTLTVLQQTINDTARFCGQQKRIDGNYNHTREITEEMSEYLLTGKNPQIAARNRQRQNPVFHIMVNPIIQSLTKFSHVETLAHAGATIDWAIKLVQDYDGYGSVEDGHVALRRIRRITAAREKTYRTLTKSITKI